ncbi:MAG: hypothetical protein WC665_12600 [Sulfurimonas sp.]|jgi:outer membrane protein
MKRLLLSAVLLFSTLAHAEDDYSFRAAYGQVTKNDFLEILVGQIQPHRYDLKVLAFDGGYLLKQNAFDLPLDLYAKAGVAHFDERGLQDDIYEGTLYLKLYWNIDFLDNRARLGLGEGGSYTTDILYAEYLEAIEKNGKNSKYLNYMDVSIDLDIGKLVQYEPLHGTSIGFALKHRSGIYGLVNNVRRGGSNYYTVYLETNF